MAEYHENEKFTESIIGSTLLDEAIDWIKDNMNVDDVFDEKEISDWVSENANLEDVYEEGVLEEWAESNGYKKEE